MRVLFALCLAAVTVSAQNVGETVLVQLVEIPVTVTGGDGKAVRGLTKADFELYDEGKRVPIGYFEVLDMKAMDTSAKRPPAAATRNFLLLFDVGNSAPGSIRRAGEAAKEFVTTQLGARDLAAVGILNPEEGLRMITAFTPDAKMLTAAIDAVSGRSQYFKVNDPLMLSYRDTSATDSTVQMPGFAPTERQEGAIERRNAKAQAADALLDPSMANKAIRQGHDTEMRNRLRIQLSNMGNVARMLDRLHGRKQVILLSEGFDPALVRGKETVVDRAQQKSDDRRLKGEVWIVDNDQRFGSGIASRDVRDMVELFRRSDVVLHAIDIKGLRGNTDAGSGPHDPALGRSNEALFMITGPTGGTVFQNTNDLGETFARMLEQQEVVYLLGFQAVGAGNPGSFHELKVKTTARGARVSHRPGYYEPSLRASNVEKTLSTAEILLTDAPVHELDVTLAAATIPGPDGKARVPVVVELDGSKLLEGVMGDTSTANLFIYAFDSKHQVADYLTQRMVLDLTRARDALANGLRYYGTLRLAPGDYAVKVVARVEDSDRAGFVRANVHVPEFGKPIVLPPLFLNDMTNWAMLAGPVRGDDYAYPFAAGEDRWVPSGRPVLSASGEYKLALLAYDLSLDGASIAASVVGSDGVARPGSVTVVARTPPDSWNGTKLLLAFKPEGLANGSYELHLAVRPQAGEESRVAVAFEVE